VQRAAGGRFGDEDGFGALIGADDGPSRVWQNSLQRHDLTGATEATTASASSRRTVSPRRPAGSRPATARAPA
jgi:hypothetical protein